MEKRTKFQLGILVLIGVVIAGIFLLKEYTYRSNLILEKETNLTTEQKQIFLDRISEAQKNLEKTENVEEKYSWQLQMAFDVFALGKLDQAKNEFKKAIGYDSEGVGAYVGLFETYKSMNDIKAARESILRAIDIRPANQDAWIKYLTFEIAQKSLKQETIVSLYEKALKQTNNNIDIITNYARYLELINDMRAVDYWSLAGEANPSMKETYQAEIERLKSK